MSNVFAKSITSFAVVGILIAGIAPSAAGEGPAPLPGAAVEAQVFAEKPNTRETYQDVRSLVNPGGTPADLVRATGDRAISCSPEAFPEGEANCGLDASGLPNDTLNGGCSSTFQFFFPTFCGDRICGTSAWNGVARDTDWYELTVFSTTNMTWEVTADFDAVIGLAGGTDGQPDCQLVTGITPFRIVPRGQTDSVTVCLGPGTWWFVVIPDMNQPPFQCGRQYEASLTCTTACPEGACCFSALCDNGYTLSACSSAGGVYLGDNTSCSTENCDSPPNDNLCNAQPIVPGEDVIADLRSATLEPWGELPPCALPGGVASVWYTFEGNGAQMKISTCISEQLDPYATDSVIAVYTGSCSNPPSTLDFLHCNDDFGCGGTGRLSSICTFATQVGTTYFIQVIAWSEDTRGRYAVETDFPCTQPDPSGACCIPTTFGPFCDEIDQSACEQFDGVFQGAASSCTTADCTGVEIPPNDDCDGAIFLSIPGSDIGDTTFATPDGVTNDCGLPLQSPGVWYRVIGTGNTITAHLCSGNTLFDARLHVFCNNCSTAQFICVAANDDALDAGCATKPSVSWCSAPGDVYFLLVTGTGGAEGLFEISVDDDGVSCPNPAVCDPNCFVTCPPGATSENEPTCLDNYTDITNGGCGSSPEVFGQIVPGETICGTSGNFPLGGGRGRDIDWYAFTIQQQCDVTWTVHAEFLVETFILNDQCGLGLASYAESRGNACQDVVVQTTLEPGDYTILIQPQFFFGAGCGSVWYGTLECVPTANNGACCLDVNTCIDTTEAHCTTLGGGFGVVGELCAQTVCEPAFCPADFDGDGVITVFDFGILAFNWEVGPNATHAQGDANGDGWVDVFDFGILASTFETFCP